MGVKMIVKKLNKAFSVENKKDKHYESINALLEKLKEKENAILLKRESETNKYKRKKQKRSLAVIRAQQEKAQKLLDETEHVDSNLHRSVSPSPIQGLGSLHH